MSTLYPSLESLIISVVPEVRYDSRLKRELIAQSEGILSRKHGQYEESDLQVVSEQIRRHLILATPSGSSATKFTNLLSRLLDQPVLARKHASVGFLHSLAALPQASPTAPAPASTSQQRGTLAPTRGSAIPPLGGKSKAALLREYRQKAGQSHLPEHLLIRDASFLLQGISGKYVRFSANGDNSLIFSEDSRHLVPPSTRNLIHRLSEVGYLYSRVEQFVREREGAEGVGMIEQSLCHHLQSQLTEYYQLIAVLESQAPSNEENLPMDGSSNSDNQNALTLRRLDVWINDWRLRMRMMSVCVEGARDSHGGALVNLIHGYADTGDPFIRKFTDQLLEEVSEPFFTTLHKWLFSGELYDPFSEFFVTTDSSGLRYLHPSTLTGGVDFIGGDGGFGGENDDTSEMREGGLQLWQTKYRFQKEMLPKFVGEVFGKKIFSTGKSLNFIRYSCHDSDWVVTREKMMHTRGTLKYSDISGLERSIDVAYQTASRRLFEVFLEKFLLSDHLKGIKNYLLLGHGDFADKLLDLIGEHLHKPANTLSRHNLTSTLETAVRSTNAVTDSPEVLRCLDARILEYSRGEIGWDSFTLEYKIDPPIDTVLDPGSMEKYQKLFKHLWQIKRIEIVLSTGWMRIAGGTRTFLRVPELNPEWHSIRITMAEMIHFIRSLQAYCHLEVIECSWKRLADFLDKREGDLDAMIDAHQTYLDSVLRKALLLQARRGKEETVLSHVKLLFSSILRFHDAIEDFYNYCLSESSRRDEALDFARGVYTGRPRERPVSTANLDELRERLNQYGNEFSDRVPILVSLLHGHTDFDCRLLATRLSFSDFYKGKREHSQKA